MANQNALQDDNNKSSLLWDFNGETKRITVWFDWSLKMSTSDGAGRTSFNTIFWDTVTASKQDNISLKWNLGLIADDFVITENNGATATETNSRLFLQSSTATNWQVIIESRDRVIYRPWHDLFWYFTYAWPEWWVAWSINYIWIYDDNDWYYIWYNGTDFVIWRRKGWVDYQVTQANWNKDKLDWTWNSWFILDHTKINIFRVNFWYLWIAPCIFEIKTSVWWVEFHTTDTLNNSDELAIENPNLPIRAEITKTSGTTNITWYSGSWNWWYYNWGISYIWNKANNYNTWLWQALTWTWVENVVIFHLKDTFNGKQNVVTARMVHADFNNNATWDIIKASIIANPTSVWWTAVASLTYTDIDTNNSTVEYSAWWWVIVWWKTIYAQYQVGGGWWNSAFAWWWSVTAQELWLIWRPWDYFAVVYQRVSWTGAYNALMNINWLEVF